MKKIARTLIAALGLFTAGGYLYAAPLPTVTTCEIGTGAQYGVKSKDCSPAAQQAACVKYTTNPKLSPAKPVGCKTFNTMDELKEGLRLARLSRDAPQKPTAPVPGAPPAVPGAPAPAPGAPPAAAPAAPAKIPVIVTCTGKTTFVALGNSCAEQQQACDAYKDAPQLGPSKATGCKTFQNKSDLIIEIKKAAAAGTFPGFGGGVVTCKSRGEGKQYAEAADSCQMPSQQAACEVAKGIADPVSCKEVPTDLQIKQELEKLPKLSGIECQMKMGGIGYRAIVPDCSDAVKKSICNPKDADVKGCQAFPNAQAAKDWAGVFINEAFVSCRLNAMPAVVYQIPGRDCSEATKKTVCGVAATPVGCEKKEIEKLRQELAKR